MKVSEEFAQAFLAEMRAREAAMTDEERAEQRASWAYGQCALMRRYEHATEAELEALRQMCRRMAGCKT